MIYPHFNKYELSNTFYIYYSYWTYKDNNKFLS